MCSWPTRVAADKALLLTSVVAFVLVPPPPPPPPPEPVAVPTEPVGLIGVIGSRLSEPAPPVAVIRVSLGEVAGVRMPRLSYLPFGEPAEDDDDEDDEDEDELEEEEEDAVMGEEEIGMFSWYFKMRSSVKAVCFTGNKS